MSYSKKILFLVSRVSMGIWIPPQGGIRMIAELTPNKIEGGNSSLLRRGPGSSPGMFLG